MAVGRPIRPKLPGSPKAAGRATVGVALMLPMILSFWGRPAGAQWATEPPPFDPFARVARASDYADAAASNGSVSPPPSGPAVNGPPGPAQPAPGVYYQAPPYYPPANSLPPVAVQGPAYQDPRSWQQAVPAVGTAAPPAGDVCAGWPIADFVGIQLGSQVARSP